MTKILEEYLEKLQIKKEEPSLEYLQTLQKAHLAHFSFNNIAVLLGKEISLDISDIAQKIIHDGLGGYCFEHNKLFYEILKEMGFEVRFVVGKVQNSNKEIDVPKTHRITIVTFDAEEYLVDVGFGYVCPNNPLAIHSDKEDGSYKITKLDEETFALKLLLTKGDLTLYKFNLHRYSEADCLMGNFYSSNYKCALFVNNFVLSLIQKDKTLSLRNGTYHKIYKDQEKITKIETEEELFTTLQNDFSITLKEDEIKKLLHYCRG